MTDNYMDHHLFMQTLSSWFAHVGPEIVTPAPLPPHRPADDERLAELLRRLVGARVESVVVGGEDDVTIHFTDGRELELGYRDWAFNDDR